MRSKKKKPPSAYADGGCEKIRPFVLRRTPILLAAYYRDRETYYA